MMVSYNSENRETRRDRRYSQSLTWIVLSSEACHSIIFLVIKFVRLFYS